METTAPILWWVRRDLRLSDNPALAGAAASGRPVIPVFVHDETVAALGAAPKWRLGEGLAALAGALEARGARLILRRGGTAEELLRIAEEAGAAGVVWNRLHEPAAKAQGRDLKRALRARGLSAQSFGGHLLFEPDTVATQDGAPYKVYTPFWRAVKDRTVDAPAPAPRIRAPDQWPLSDRLGEWRMGAAMDRGAAVVARHANVGEAAALGRLGEFIAHRIDHYRARRDFPAEAATSRLSENLAWGEIGVRTIWHAGLRAHHEGRAGAEQFLKELVWREFAWHLLHHSPRIAERNWREQWDAFPWRGDNADAERWRQGRTGVQMVDAAMREMYVTGTMHNRARMIAASYLTKHLLTDWRVGQAWFAECLIDWDPAANALGWQWVAGSGPDAAPYFRIFNPETQAAKFDPDAGYRHRFIAELSPDPGRDARDYFRAVPRSWDLSPKAAYPAPVIGLKAGRERALAAYHGARS